MKACAVVVGFNHWYGDTFMDKKFTRSFTFDLKHTNPNLDILLIDNASAKPYPSDIGGIVEVIRLPERVGYAVALNVGLKHLQQQNDYDWYICFNNDNWIDPLHPCDLGAMLDTFDPRVLYGSGWNEDKKIDRRWQWSAWLVISREILQAVGYFDELLAAAFEDFDYEQRAMDAGYTLDTADFRITHLNEHTRLEDPEYKWRWEAARLWFTEKHSLVTEPWLTLNKRRRR